MGDVVVVVMDGWWRVVGIGGRWSVVGAWWLLVGVGWGWWFGGIWRLEFQARGGGGTLPVTLLSTTTLPRPLTPAVTATTTATATPAATARTTWITATTA